MRIFFLVSVTGTYTFVKKGRKEKNAYSMHISLKNINKTGVIAQELQQTLAPSPRPPPSPNNNKNR